MKSYCVTITMMSDPLQILLPSVLKARTCLHINGISKIMVQFCTIFKHWNCFLCSVATDGKDGNGLKLCKRYRNFSSFNAGYARNNHQKIIMVIVP